MSELKKHWTDKLSEYLDGTLSGDDVKELEGHLPLCADCRDVAQDLEQIVAEAKALPLIPPSDDLWLGIAARIRDPHEHGAPSYSESTDDSRGSFWGLRFSFSLPQLAAAGITLALVVGGLSWWTARNTEFSPSHMAFDGSASSESVLAASSRAYVEFAQEVSSLKRILVEDSDKLDPETARVIEKNLKIIEEAIAQSRLALENDPANAYVQEHLVATMGGKIKMLRRATDVALAQAEGI
jgi:anti-sigma factor RsiW